MLQQKEREKMARDKDIYSFKEDEKYYQDTANTVASAS